MFGIREIQRNAPNALVPVFKDERKLYYGLRVISPKHARASWDSNTGSQTLFLSPRSSFLIFCPLTLPPMNKMHSSKCSCSSCRNDKKQYGSRYKIIGIMGMALIAVGLITRAFIDFECHYFHNDIKQWHHPLAKRSKHRQLRNNHQNDTASQLEWEKSVEEVLRMEKRRLATYLATTSSATNNLTMRGNISGPASRLESRIATSAAEEDSK
jgi:hypothetical protein